MNASDELTNIDGTILTIKPNNKLEISAIHLDICTASLDGTFDPLDEVIDEIKRKYSCNCTKSNIFLSRYPEFINYHILYNDTPIGHVNNMATKIVNKPGVYCYGNAYVIYYDIFGELHDITPRAFLDSLNTNNVDPAKRIICCTIC